MNMREKRKTLILIILIVILVILITFITALFIINKQDTNNIENNNEIISYWFIYKQEIVSNNQIINTIDTNSININIKRDKIDICYINTEDDECNSVNYTYSNNTLNIPEDNQYFYGTYNVIFEDNIMILEKIENKEKDVRIRNYFQKPES